MDPISSLALTAVLAAAWFYVLYLVVYRAVKNAIRDAGALARKQEEGASRQISDE